MVRWVHGQHVVGELGSGQALVDDVGIMVEGGDHVLGQPLVGQGVPRRRVAEHHPRAAAIGELDVLHRTLTTGRGEGREGVVANGVVPVAPDDGGHELSAR